MKRKDLAKIAVGLCNKVLLKHERPELPEMTAKEWDKMLNFASMQGILPIIIQIFDKLTVKDDQTRMVIIDWYGTAAESGTQYQMRVKTMRELSKIFEKGKIDVMFMKGATLAQLYLNPQWRVFDDIDFYLFGEFERGVKLMSEHGIENYTFPHHHTQAFLNDVMLENHYDFVERVNHRSDVVLDDALKALAEKEGRNIPAAFLGDDIKNAYVMTPTMNAVFLMRHMSTHFASETIPLRMLYDWVLFLERQGKEVDWQLVLKLYEQSGMMRFAGIIQQLVCLYLDYENKDCPIGLGKTEDAEMVWESIVNPPEQNPHGEGSLMSYLFETKTFFANRWKHKIVYPGESFVLLFFKYVWLGVKRMTRSI